MKSRKARTRHKGRLVPLVSPVAVSRLLRSVIDERYDGKIARAANQSGIARTWLRRMTGSDAELPQAIQPTVLVKLKKFVGRDLESDLRLALFPPAVDSLTARHREWLKQVRASAARGTGSWWEIRNGRIVRSRNRKNAEGLTRRQQERYTLIDHLKRQNVRLYQRLSNLIALNYHLGRAELIWSRVLDPVIESAESGLIEPSWRDLNRSELENLISLGLRREEILTPRLAAEERALHLLARGDHHFQRRWVSALSGRRRPYRRYPKTIFKLEAL